MRRVAYTDAGYPFAGSADGRAVAHGDADRHRDPRGAHADASPASADAYRNRIADA